MVHRLALVQTDRWERERVLKPNKSRLDVCKSFSYGLKDVLLVPKSGNNRSSLAVQNALLACHVYRFLIC